MTDCGRPDSQEKVFNLVGVGKRSHLEDRLENGDQEPGRPTVTTVITRV